MNTKAAVRSIQSNPADAAQASETLSRLLARSATDMEFRSTLLSNPRAALAEFSGSDVPSDMKIVFVENTADATIVLPDPVDPAAPLSESELESVAGGATPLFIATAVLVSAVTNSFFQGRNDGQEH